MNQPSASNQLTPSQQVKSGFRISFIGVLSLITYSFLFLTVPMFLDSLSDYKSTSIYSLYHDLITKNHLLEKNSFNFLGMAVLGVILVLFVFVTLLLLIPTLSNWLALRIGRNDPHKIAQINQKILKVLLIFNLTTLALFVIRVVVGFF